MNGFMHVMSFFGSGAFYVPVLATVFWCVSPRWGARATIVLGLNGILNAVLKLVWHAPRPYWTDPGVTPGQSQTSFGMPSGHAQNSVVGYGLVGVAAWRGYSGVRRWAVPAAAVVVAVLIGVSRIYLGVHSPGQVLVGWAVGGAVLVAALLLEPVVVPWWTRWPLAVQLGLSLAVALAVLGADALAVAHLHDWVMPASWQAGIERAGGQVRPVDLTEGATAAGTLFGGLAGVSWLARRGWFEAGGAVRTWRALWLRLARLAVGFGGAGALFGLGVLLPHAPAWRFVVQAAVGLWAAAGAPEVFVRTGLASRDAQVPTPAVTRPGESPAEPGS